MEFDALVIEWRGPAPHVFARVPEDVSDTILEVETRHSYGWGCIPVTACIEGRRFTTSLMPHDEVYVLPLKKAVREPAGWAPGDVLHVEMTLG